MGKRGPLPDPNSRRSREGRNGFKPQLVGPEYLAPAPERTIADIPVRPPPSWLGRAGRECWRQHQRRLELGGSLTDKTAGEFATMCAAWQTYREAERELSSGGRVLTSPTGRAYPNPWVRIRKDALAEYRTGCDRFGLKPLKTAALFAPPMHAAAAPAPADDQDDLD